ncbi:MAG: type IV pilin protein, partial [Aeromonadaceae bacterium]
YQQWVCQSRRGAAINQLLTLQLRQEAYKVEQGQFSTSLAALGPASDEHYDYALNTTATGYLLTAYAKAASPQRSDQGCQRLTLDVDAQRWPPACWP